MKIIQGDSTGSDMSHDGQREDEMATPALQTCDLLETLPRATAPTGKLQECVLLIEDSEDAMLLVKYALQEYGDGRYRLEWATSLSDGLEQLSKGGIDVVLLDLGLPETSGPASYAWVREIAPEIPVVVLTGDAREETEFSVTASGVEDYLVKDQISGSLLLQALRAALYANRRRRNPKTLTHKITQRYQWTSEN